MNSRVTGGVDWVGYVDWTVRDFHGYNTPRGATYNAYLVRDEKTTLIDTVKSPFAAQLLQNVATLTDLAAVDYVVCNHAETDHAGSPVDRSTRSNWRLIRDRSPEPSICAWKSIFGVSRKLVTD